MTVTPDTLSSAPIRVNEVVPLPTPLSPYPGTSIEIPPQRTEIYEQCWSNRQPNMTPSTHPTTICLTTTEYLMRGVELPR